MNATGFISKENPVWLYKIVRSSHEDACQRSFKEFILVEAWSSKCDDVLKTGKRYFDYYYNNRLHRKQEVGIGEYLPFTDSKNFNIWMYERDDSLAVAECRRWIEGRINRTKQSIKREASKLIQDKEFLYSLSVSEDTNLEKLLKAYESKLQETSVN